MLLLSIILVIAAVILFVKFEKVFLMLAIPSAMLALVLVFQENAQKMAVKSVLVDELIGELEQEGYSDGQIDNILAAKNLKRPTSVAEKRRDVLRQEGYSDAKIDAILSGRGLEPPANQ